MNCRDAVRLYESGVHSGYKGFRVKLHFMGCKACRNYRLFTQMLSDRISETIGQAAKKLNEKLLKSFSN